MLAEPAVEDASILIFEIGIVLCVAKYGNGAIWRAWVALERLHNLSSWWLVGNANQSVTNTQ